MDQVGFHSPLHGLKSPHSKGLGLGRLKHEGIGDMESYPRDQVNLRDIRAAQDNIIFLCRFGDLNGFKGQNVE